MFALALSARDAKRLIGEAGFDIASRKEPERIPDRMAAVRADADGAETDGAAVPDGAAGPAGRSRPPGKIGAPPLFRSVVASESRRDLTEAIIGIVGALPSWAVARYVDQYDEYAPIARLFIDTGAERHAAVAVAKQRVFAPVTGAFTDAFGYDKSGYQAHYDESGELAPNVGILTLALVDVEPVHATRAATGGARDVYVYHAVGAALDEKTQPDYIHYVEGKEADGIDVALIAFYRSVFAKVFAAAVSVEAHGIVLPLVGTDRPTLYPGGSAAMRKRVTKPAFDAVRRRYPTIKAIGPGIGTRSSTTVGNYEGILRRAERWMVVTECSCHAIPGAAFVGQSAAVDFFGWGVANTHLGSDNSVVTVDVDVP